MNPEMVDKSVQSIAVALGIGTVAMYRIVGSGERNGQWLNNLVLDEVTKESYQIFVRELDSALEKEDPERSESIQRIFQDNLQDVPAAIRDALMDMVLENA